MNDILNKTAKFFFVPEADISFVFLIIFFGIFIFGVYRQNKCRELLRNFDAKADENFEDLVTKMTPETFIKKNLRKLAATENLLEELPNIFVSVGIVATFLGLGVAIQGAAELLQTDQLELPKLTAVLEVMAFKFQTSVWGVCFSIVFRSLILERYFDFRRQLLDDLTDRLFLLERENSRTLLELQNILLVEQHEEIISSNATLNRALIERLTTLEAALHADNQRQNKLLAEQNRETLSSNAAFNRALIEKLNELEATLHADNLSSANYLSYLTRNFKDFVDVAQNFARNELTFAKSVDAFSQRVKLFQAEFATLIHKELDDLKAVNKNLELTHVEHIKKIHDEHAANIFYTTQELDKLHQKFYLDAGNFAEESRKALDNLLKSTVGQVHDEYTREAHEIRDAIDKIRSVLSEIKENVDAMNQEFTDEQKKIVSSWHFVTGNVSKTINHLDSAFSKEAVLLEKLHGLLAEVTRALQKNHAENLEQNARFLQSFTDTFQTQLSAQSQTVADAVESLQKNLSRLTSNNESVTENLREDLVSVKNALENLTIAVNANEATLKTLLENAHVSPGKHLAEGRIKIPDKFAATTDFERRQRK